MIDRSDTRIQSAGAAAVPGGASDSACPTGSAGLIDRLGPALVYSLFSAARTVQIHDLNNRASQTALSRLVQTLEQLLAAEGRITLAVNSDLLSVNDVRIIVDSQSVGPILYLIDQMKKMRVEEIDFAPGIMPGEMGSFLKLFFAEANGEDVFGELTRRLADAGTTNIRPTEWIEREHYLRDAKIERREVREESNKAMARAVRFMGEVLRAIEQRRPIQIPKAHRLTQQIADIIRVDESVLVGLASIKDYDEYTFSHSVNVSVLSMLIADRLRLGKNETAQLGVAALFHDIGKTHIPLSILNKPKTLDPDEWKFMERHTMLGVIELSRVRSLQAVLDPVFVSLQHHLLYNGEGYPHKPGSWKIHPYTPIIVVADIFDAMTSPRVYRGHTLTPDRALRFVLRKSGTMFDPLIAKAFIKAMGLYPIGTVVELDTGEKAVVIRQNGRPRMLHRPVVARLGDGGPQDDLIDLTELSEDGVSWRRTIVRAIHDRSLEAQKADCFIVK
jgi:putative nucleotidyltransferase with HDIG domain